MDLTKIGLTKLTNNMKKVTEKTVPKIAILSLAVSVLSACSAIPPSEDHSTVIAEPNVLLNKPYTTLDNPTVSTPAPSIAAQRWQYFYSDRKLRHLIAFALQNNKDLEAALLNIKQAKAQYQISDNNSLPSVGMSGSASRSANHIADKNPTDALNVNLGMSSYELDLWGRIASLKEQALQNYLATTAGKDTAQITLISNIAQAYVNLSYAKAQYQLAKSTVESRQQSLFITQKRFEAGVDSKSPSLQASSSLENAKSAMYQAETNIMKLQNALRLMVGAPIPPELMPKAGVINISSQKVFNAGLPSQLLHYRPDILQAEYNLKAAGANIDAARAAYFPAVSLTGRFGVSSNEVTDLFNTDSIGWSFGPSVSVPIFDAGKLDSQHEVAKIKQQQALVAYEKSIQNAFKEVSDVLADRATLDKRLNSQYKLQDNLNETYNIALARYKAGLSDYLSVLDSERSMFSAQQSILGLEQARLISQINLYKALGGGVEMDVPVELSVPNHPDLVEFISTTAPTPANVDKIDDAKAGNKTVTLTNVARTVSNSRLATKEDYQEKEKIKQQEATKAKNNSMKKMVEQAEKSQATVEKFIKDINKKVQKTEQKNSSE